MSIEKINEYVTKIKSVDYKNRAEVLGYRKQKKIVWLNELAWDKNALIQPRPKVDSTQARVQCSIHIDKLINSGIKFQKKEINILIESGPRIRKSKK